MTISNLRFIVPDSNVLNDAADCVLDTPESLLTYWKRHVSCDPTLELRKEHLIVIPLDSRLKPVGHTIVSVGSSNETIAHPGEVLRPVLVAGAKHFILIHNHPSGNPSPSLADNKMTKKINEGAEIVQVRLVDHIIVGNAPQKPLTYHSYREAGDL